ncbi:MAG: GNAT family N-acetyltransferase [Bacteroidetes bacterium]|nr:GNAT family N-acetyltransferase [Bacteroidota bacterium]
MIDQPIEISVVTNDEIDLLRTISIQTFTETFADQNTESDMLHYISEKLSTEQLFQELHSLHSEFYYIKLQNQVLGYLKLNSGAGQTEKQNGSTLEIERIYVLKEFHGRHLGHLLLQKAKDIALKNHCEYIWLGVWERNTKAITFYNKHGFIAYDKHIFKLGNDEQTDILMKLKLN